MKNFRVLKWSLVFGLCFLASCTGNSLAPLTMNRDDSAVNSNVNANVPTDNPEAAAIRENEQKVKELEAQNERFKVVPPGFQNVDFKNFTYPTRYPKKSVTLKDGELEYEIRENGGLGGGWFGFSDVYYVDLTGDGVKEAFVMIFRVDCGGSCDGGTYLLYVYSSKNRKPVLIWQFELGSQAYTCGLKSLTVKEMKIYFDVFDNCFEKNGKLEDQPDGNTRGKGLSFGVTEFIYRYDGKSFVREKTQFGQPQRFEHRGYSALISIND